MPRLYKSCESLVLRPHWCHNSTWSLFGCALLKRGPPAYPVDLGPCWIRVEKDSTCLDHRVISKTLYRIFGSLVLNCRCISDSQDWLFASQNRLENSRKVE